MQPHATDHPEVHWLCVKSVVQEGIATSYKTFPFTSIQWNNTQKLLILVQNLLVNAASIQVLQILKV